MLVCNQTVLAAASLNFAFQLFVVVIVMVHCHINVHCCLLLQELRWFAYVWEVRPVHTACIGYIERLRLISLHFKFILEHLHFVNLNIKLCFLCGRHHVRMPHNFCREGTTPTTHSFHAAKQHIGALSTLQLLLFEHGFVVWQTPEGRIEKLLRKFRIMYFLIFCERQETQFPREEQVVRY